MNAPLDTSTPTTAPRVLVTGASGFLGGALVRALVARGERVRVVQRSSTAALDALAREGHVELALGSLEDAAHVARAAEGVETLFHVAAKAGVWGPEDAYFRANVVGTRSVLAAARAAGVTRLVYTSTPSVVHAGGDVEGVDESAPYATHFATHYPKTKSIAEREVRAADGDAVGPGRRLRTVALRPHLIWGPGDTNLVPRILERARSGRLVLVGGGEKKIDGTFIASAVHAHLLAAEALARAEAKGEAPACGGRAYFIAQGEPMPARELILGIVRAHGLDVAPRSIPLGAAKVLGGLVELGYRALGREDEPPLTRFVAEQLGTAHWYSLAAAERDLGYRAPVTVAEGLAQLAASVRG